MTRYEILLIIMLQIVIFITLSFLQVGHADEERVNETTGSHLKY